MVAQAIDRRFYAQQFDFIADPHKWVAFVGGRSSGKTYAGSWKALGRALRPNPGVGVIAAPDFPMLEFGAKRQFIERLREAGIRFDLNKQTAVLTIPRSGAEIRFATLETESRIRGPNYAWGWVDELDYEDDWEIWQALKGAIRDGAAPQLFATSTPKGRRLIWREWVEGATADHALYRASTLDNPYIDATGYVAALGYAGRFYRQEIDAQFEGAEGLVYPAFDRIKHVQERPDALDWPAVLGVDAGTNDPSVINTIHYHGQARHHAREMYYPMDGRELMAAVAAEAERLGSRLAWIVIDPSAKWLRRALEVEGWPIVAADNAIEDGIREVTSCLAGDFTIDPACVETIREYESYAYPDGFARAVNKPKPGNDHSMDASRYALMSLAEPEPEPMIWA